jgi:hypothetical protein
MNKVPNVCWKLWLIFVKASAKRCRVVWSIRGRLGRLRDRVHEILLLTRQESVTRLELVELLDRHHVHRAEAVDLPRSAAIALRR